MNTTEYTSLKKDQIIYAAMTIGGLIVLLFLNDFGTSGSLLALALAFNPFPEKNWKTFSLAQKAMLLIQVLFALGLILFSFFQEVIL